MKESFIAKTYPGIENILLNELIKLGAENCILLNRAVSFEGDMLLLYKVNYFCRTALRVLWQISAFTFENKEQYYNEIYKIKTEKFLTEEGTLAISATINESIFQTPLYASVLAKDAICDRFRENTGKRPSVNKDEPDVSFHLHINRNEATVFLDSSGESLHKRGYKISNHPAPINEVVAAAMIELSGWDAKSDFIDFMCGSGTILIEAAMRALNIPAAFYRKHFGFFTWLNFDRNLWEQTTQSADIKDDIDINLYGYDISSRHLGMAVRNVEEACLQDFIYLERKDFQYTRPKRIPSFIITNPPYGERLEVEDLDALYSQIGDTLKKNYSGCTAYIISSDKNALKSIGLHPSGKTTLYNGQLECKYLKFDLYQGTKKNT